MYHYVTDKVFMKEAYGICADIVNQLVQRLKKEEIETEMNLVGSKKRGLVMQNEREAIDFDFNLLVKEPERYSERQLKEVVMRSFNEVLRRNGWGDCRDSTSVLTTKERILINGNKTPFSIDVCLVKQDTLGFYRLIHEKTGFIAMDRYYWNPVPNTYGLKQKEDYLKPDYWPKVREVYKEKKNMYLLQNDHNHPSFICYIEAVNEVYQKAVMRLR